MPAGKEAGSPAAASGVGGETMAAATTPTAGGGQGGRGTTTASPPSSWQKAQAESNAEISSELLNEIEQRYVTTLKDLNETKELLATKEGELKQAQGAADDCQQWQRKAKEMENQLLATRHSVQSLEESKKAAEERVDRVKIESDQLREEISRLTKTNAELNKSVAEYEVQSKMNESEAIPLVHENSRLKKELDNIRAHADWLQQEFDAKSRDYTKLQQETRDRNLQLQLQLDQTINDKETAAARLHAIEKIEHALQDKVSMLSQDVLHLKQEKTSVEETSKSQVLEMEKIVDTQRKHIERLNTKNADVVRENELMKKQAELAMEEADKEKQAALKELQDKYELQIEQIGADFEDKLRRGAGGTPSRSSRAVVVGAGGAPGGMEIDDEEGEEDPVDVTNLTELNTRLYETKAKLRRERVERKRVEGLLQKTKREIDAAAPMMLRQRKEYEIAVSRVSDYEKRLADALADRDHSREDTREARQEAVSWKNQFTEMKREAKELSKQVQALLISRAGGQVAAGDNIPTSVAEMQGQNQRLIAEHSRLKARIAELEGKLQRDTLRLSLDAANSELAGLREDRKKQEIYVEKVVQQRDLYRALLVQHDSNLLGSEEEEITALELSKQQAERAKKFEQKNKDLVGELAAARSEAATVVKAKEEVSERLARYELLNGQLSDSITNMERQLLSARSDKARAEADSQYHRERAERLEQDLERSREEVRHVTNSKRDTDAAIASTQEALTKAQADSSNKQSEAQQAIMKLRLAQAQIETVKSSESRLAKENNQLRAEVALHGTTVDSIRRIEATLVANTEKEKEALKLELERLSKELEQVKSKDTSEAERIRQLQAQIEGIESSKTKAEADALKAKKDLLDAKADAQSLSSKCSQLEGQLRSAKTKLGEAGGGEEDDDVLLRTKIESLTSDLDAARAENKSLSEQVNNLGKIAKESETALGDLRKASDNIKAAHATETDNLKKRIESMAKDSQSKQEVIKELTDDLASQRGEQQKREKDLQNQIDLLKAEMESNNKDTQSSRTAVASLKLDAENLRVDLERTQRNYERELELHSDARTKLRAARERAEEETRRSAEAVEKFDSLKEEVEQKHILWEQERLALKESADQAEKTLKESREQNKVLHAQLESLGEMVEKAQGARLLTALESTSEEAGDLQKVIAELRELVRLLRSENEMVQAQLDNATRNAERERSSASIMRSQVDELRAQLQALQSQEVGTQDDTRQVVELKESLLGLEQTVKLLNDSNQLLREEAGKNTKLLAEYQQKLDAASKSAEPAQKVQRDLETKVAALEAEKTSLNRDLDDWKNRVKSLVSKFNQVDPEEHRQLKNKVAELEKERESQGAWKRTTEQESTRMRNIALQLKNKNSELVATVEKQKKEIEKLNAASKNSAALSAAASERDELKRKVLEMQKEAASKKAELVGSTTQNERLREMLRKFQSNIKDLKTKEKDLTAQNISLQGKLESQMKIMQQRQKDTKGGSQTEDSKIVESKPAGATAPAPTPPAAAVAVAATTTPAAKLEDKGKQAVVPPTPVPFVPEGGFKFGPSDTGAGPKVAASSQKADVSESKTSAGKPPDTPAALRVEAKPFVPSVGASAEQTKNDDSPAEQTPPATKAVLRRPSTATKEMSMKEKLLEKKRKMAEIMLKKKAALAKQATSEAAKDAAEKEETGEGDQEQPSKRTKVATDGSSSPVPSEPKSGSDPNAPQPSSGASNEEKETAGQKMEEKGGDANAAGAMAKQKEPEAPKEQSGMPCAAPAANPFAAAAASSTPGWGTTSTGGTSTLAFGQSSTVAPTFGVKPETPTKPAPPSTGGAAFLNMKPPGSSTAPPMFQFGKSGSITLPTPSQTAPTPSPFGAFGGGGASFGGFGSSSAAFGSSSTTGAMPLFGAPATTSANAAPGPAATPTEGDDAGKSDAAEGGMED